MSLKIAKFNIRFNILNTEKFLNITDIFNSMDIYNIVRLFLAQAQIFILGV